MIRVVGLITARGGSKGIPGKNLKLLAGKPLIAWTIEAALASGCADRVLLSTDDDEIASVGRQFGAEVPFLRPAHLAADRSSHVAVIEHALDWLATNEGKQPEYVLLLQPTSPLRTADDIRGIVRFATERDADAVVSVVELHPHPSLSSTMADDGTLQKPEGSRAYVRRQDLKPMYGANGALYLIRSEVLLRMGSFTPPGVYGYIMPPERSLDIDSPWDLRLADLILGSSLHSAVPNTGPSASVDARARCGIQGASIDGLKLGRCFIPDGKE
jgi:CMP-N-acetylneuraminic acid synthetase